MNKLEISQALMTGARIVAREASSRVCTDSGYYAIFVDDPCALPAPFDDLMRRNKTLLIYIGIGDCLYTRLVDQDLQGKSNSTFFRGIGTILGYRPPQGSLVGKVNQNNYKFDVGHKLQIANWANEHLLVSWVASIPVLKPVEKALIREHRPIMNWIHNPDPVPALKSLREECRKIAREPNHNISFKPSGSNI